MAVQPLDNRNSKFLDYSKISYEDTLSQVANIIKLQKANTQDLFSSSTGRMLHELFSAYTELLYRGIETGVLEGYSPVATKLSSAIVAASSLGYSVRRPVPSATSFYVVLTGTAGAYAGSFTIPRKSPFTVNGTSFVSLDDYTFKWDSTGTVKSPPKGTAIIQGSISTATFQAEEGKIFQKFVIADTTFSEYFGDSDPLNDSDLSDRITTVKVDGVYWDIDRRTLYSSDKSLAPTTSGGTLIKSRNYKCVISTNAEGNIEILFGDGIVSAIPSGSIEVSYLSTNGGGGNLYNSKDLQIEIGSSEITYSPIGSLGNSNISFYLGESANGGTDLESIQSIKYNAAKIYSALDRAVTIDDYKAILLTMPNVSHALAYGEDQLGAGDYRYFNTVLFTAINSLYTGAYGSMRPSTPAEYILSGFNTLGVAQSIQDSAKSTTSNIRTTFDSKFNLSSKTNDVSTQEKYVQYVNSLGSIFRLSRQNIDSTSQLGYIMRTLRNKGQATVSHIYFPSKVHKYSMKIEVFVVPISTKNSIATDIQQKSFAYLKDNTHFNFPIYSSKIIKIIESLNSIVGCHVAFEPYATIPNDSKYLDILLTDSLAVMDDLFNSMSKLQELTSYTLFPEYMQGGALSKNVFIAKTLDTFAYNGSTLINYNNLHEQNVSNFINYVWENTLGRMLLNPNVVNGNIASIADFSSQTYRKSIETGGLLNTDFNEMLYDTFIRWAVQFRNDTDYYTAKYCISAEGDISNFTLPNEIAQIELDTVSDITIISKNN